MKQIAVSPIHTPNPSLVDIGIKNEHNPYTESTSIKSEQTKTDNNNMFGLLSNFISGYNSINPNNITENITNQLIELLNDPELVYANDPELLIDPNHNLSIYIIDKCYDWIEVTLQPIAHTSGYLVKNTIITTTVPFSLMFNDGVTVLMTIQQSTSFLNKLKNLNLLTILSNKKEPKANFLSPYIENSEAELENIKANLDRINLFRIQIKNSILTIVNLIITKLTEINKKNKNEKITEFIDALESTKQDKSDEVSAKLFTTFSEVIFGYKSANEKEETGKEVNTKGGKNHLFFNSRRTTRRRRSNSRRRSNRRRSNSRRRSNIRRRSNKRRTNRRQQSRLF